MTSVDISAMHADLRNFIHCIALPIFTEIYRNVAVSTKTTPSISRRSSVIQNWLQVRSRLFPERETKRKFGGKVE